MIENEIDKILESEISLQAKVNELHRLGKYIYEKIHTNAILTNNAIAPRLKEEIAAKKNEIDEIEKALGDYKIDLMEMDKIDEQLGRLKDDQKTLAELKDKRVAILQLPAILEEVSDISEKNAEEIGRIIVKLKIVENNFEPAGSDSEKEISIRIQDLEEKLNLIKNNEESVLEKLSLIPLKSRFEAICKKVNLLISEYNQYAEKIVAIKVDLATIQYKHSEIIEQYKSHQLENVTIYGELSSREGGVLEYVDILVREINERLEKFDKSIKMVVLKRDELPIYKLEELKIYQ